MFYLFIYKFQIAGKYLDEEFQSVETQVFNICKQSFGVTLIIDGSEDGVKGINKII